MKKENIPDLNSFLEKEIKVYSGWIMDDDTAPYRRYLLLKEGITLKEVSYEKETYLNPEGKCHNVNGPAVVVYKQGIEWDGSNFVRGANGKSNKIKYTEYWIDGVPLNEKDFHKHVEILNKTKSICSKMRDLFDLKKK